MSDESTQSSQMNTDEPKTADQGGNSKGTSYKAPVPETPKATVDTSSKGNSGSYGAK